MQCNPIHLLKELRLSAFEEQINDRLLVISKNALKNYSICIFSMNRTSLAVFNSHQSGLQPLATVVELSFIVDLPLRPKTIQMQMTLACGNCETTGFVQQTHINTDIDYILYHINSVVKACAFKNENTKQQNTDGTKRANLQSLV